MNRNKKNRIQEIQKKKNISVLDATAHFAIYAKFKLLANHGIPWQHSKNLHRCDTGRQCRSDDHKKRRRRVF